MAIENLGRIKGESAYESAVKAGYVGTEKQWVRSIVKGVKGEDGKTGFVNGIPIETILDEKATIQSMKQVVSQLAETAQGIYISDKDNTVHSTVLNNAQTLATNQNKNLIIKSGTYILNTTVNLTDNVIFEKNVVFTISTDIDGVVFQYNGKPIDFNGLKILVNVDNYSKRGLTINGFSYVNELDMQAKKNAYSSIQNVTVDNLKTIYPYANVSGTGICIRIGIKQIFMWTKFQLYSSHFENGFLLLTDAETDKEAFVSSCDFDLVSWRNTNSIVFSDVTRNGWSDLRIRLKNQPAGNQLKVVKLVDISPSRSTFDFTLWDMQVVPTDRLPGLIEATDHKNTYFHSFDFGTEPISKFIQWKGTSVYEPTRLPTTLSEGNMFNSNPWDFIYVFGEGILSTDSFVTASNKLLINANKLRHNTPIILEYTLPTSESYAGDFYSKFLPFIPRLPNDNYGLGKIKITISEYRKLNKSIFVEFTSSGVTSINSLAFTAYRYYNNSDFNDTKWVVSGDLYGTTTQRNSLSTEIRIPQGFKFYDTTLGKVVHNVFGVWKENKTGVVLFSGDGVTLTKTIPHGLSTNPLFYQVVPTNLVAANAGIKYITADGTNLIVTFNSAPITGVDNVKLNWKAEN